MCFNKGYFWYFWQKHPVSSHTSSSVVLQTLQLLLSSLVVFGYIVLYLLPHSGKQWSFVLQSRQQQTQSSGWQTVTAMDWTIPSDLFLSQRTPLWDWRHSYRCVTQGTRYRTKAVLLRPCCRPQSYRYRKSGTLHSGVDRTTPYTLRDARSSKEEKRATK